MVIPPINLINLTIAVYNNLVRNIVIKSYFILRCLYVHTSNIWWRSHVAHTYILTHTLYKRVGYWVYCQSRVSKKNEGSRVSALRRRRLKLKDNQTPCRRAGSRNVRLDSIIPLRILLYTVAVLYWYSGAAVQ